MRFITTFRCGAAFSAAALLALPGCARDTGEAGVKPIGVGYDPGELFQGPEPRGGIVDAAVVQMAGHNLDLGVTGFFGSAGAFTDPSSDPFETVLAFSYYFSPAIIAADEYQLVSPKGPDVEDACFVQIDTRGPLGSFRTVDVGDRMVLSNQTEDPAERTAFTMNRNPQDYPTNTTDVFIYYIGTDRLRRESQIVAPNWSFGEPMYLHFDGGFPPEGAPVASIPLPSDSADDAVGKDEGDPWVYTPEELTGVFVGNREGDEGMVPLVFDPTSPGLPSPFEGEGVLHVRWDPVTLAADDDEFRSSVTIDLKLLARDVEGEALDSGEACRPAEALEVGGGGRDTAWRATYADMKASWCDPDFEPDVAIGNDESGLDYFGTTDNCHDGVDNDGDGRCDEGGCFTQDGVRLDPDPECARHVNKTAECRTDGLCYDVGGDRSGDGHMGDLVCTAPDTPDRSSFVITAEDLASLTSRIDMSQVAGAVLAVSRVSERLVKVPRVRNQIGNAEDNNPIRFRASQVVYGRMAHTPVTGGGQE